jgi:glutathione S-transferase
MEDGLDLVKEHEMKLYYKAGACSLASHIILSECGFEHSSEAVDLASKKTASGKDFTQISAKGYVPCLELSDGSILTEGTVILQYLADQKPGNTLLAPVGTMARYRALEWLGFINSEVHKNFSPLFNPKMPAEAKALAKALLLRRLEVVASALSSQPYLTGEQFGVADAYLYTVLTWAQPMGVDLSAWPQFDDYMKRIAARPSVQRAHLIEKG